MDRLRDELENLAQDLVDSLRIQTLRQRRRVADVGEQDRDELRSPPARCAR
jgi:hypothetical protein